MVAMAGKKHQQTARWNAQLASTHKSHISNCWLTVLTIFACASMLRFLFLWQPGVASEGCTTKPPAALDFTIPAAAQPHRALANMTDREREFWKQPDAISEGVVGCIELSAAFMRESSQVVAQRTKYLMVVVNGGLNQQRNQIVDAVVMARVLGAALVVPVLEVNPIWGDERCPLAPTIPFLHSIPFRRLHSLDCRGIVWTLSKGEAS